MARTKARSPSPSPKKASTPKASPAKLDIEEEEEEDFEEEELAEGTSPRSAAVAGISWASGGLGDLAPVIILVFIVGTVRIINALSAPAGLGKTYFLRSLCGRGPAVNPGVRRSSRAVPVAISSHSAGLNFFLALAQAFGIALTVFTYQFPEWLETSGIKDNTVQDGMEFSHSKGGGGKWNEPSNSTEL